MLQPEALSIKKCSPFVASMELLTKCNYRCEHCYIPSHDAVMNSDIIYRTIEQIKDAGFFELVLTGGEILLLEDLVKIVSFARAKGLRVTLFSNISLMTDELAEKLAALYIKEISTTLFSLDTKINDDITKCKESVDKFLKAAEIIKSHNIHLEVKVPIMKKNKNSYKEIMEYCDENGFRFNYSFAITQRTDGDKEPCTFRLSEEEIADVIRVVEEDYSVQKRKNPRLCDGLCNSLHIDVNGNVYPCISFPIKYGNVREESLIDIWNNSKEKIHITSIKRNDLLMCKDCTYADFCVRCPGLAYSENNTLYGCSEIDRLIAGARKRVKGGKKDVH
jgi:radical SAM protein with 4Fe4S-binding SPASM domain